MRQYVIEEIYQQFISVKLAAGILPESGDLDLDKVKVLLAQVSAWSTRAQLFIRRCEAADVAEKTCGNIAGTIEHKNFNYKKRRK